MTTAHSDAETETQPLRVCVCVCLIPSHRQAIQQIVLPSGSRLIDPASLAQTSLGLEVRSPPHRQSRPGPNATGEMAAMVEALEDEVALVRAGDCAVSAAHLTVEKVAAARAATAVLDEVGLYFEVRFHFFVLSHLSSQQDGGSIRGSKTRNIYNPLQPFAPCSGGIDRASACAACIRTG